MRSTLRLFGLCACILFAGGAVGAQKSPDALRQDIETARKSVYPALVNISVVTRFFTGGRAQRAPAGGSGVIINKDGYVLTNYHVAGNTTRITCTLPSGEALEATVVTHDPPTDLSVLKLRLDKRKDPKIPLPFANLGDSDKLEVGDYVLAMGNPNMLASSMTLGIVSNTKRVFTDFNGTEMEEQELDTGEKTGLFTRWIQHDALILPGNSGGPLVNLKGEVVGINELGGRGVGFAIPSNIAAFVLKQALNGGVVHRSWLGLSVLPVNKIGQDDGALISAVWPGSPAAKAKLKPGDILLALDNTPVQVRFFEESPLLYQQIAALPTGKTVKIKYSRAGQTMTAEVTPTAMEKSIGEEAENREVGVTLQEITEPFARNAELKDKDGVYVTGVRPSYPFNNAQPPIQQGDIIVAVGDMKTPNLIAFQEALQKVNKEAFVVSFRREDEDLLTVVKITPDKEADTPKELPKAWIGVKTQVLVPDVAAALKIPGKKGFRVTEVYPLTEASKAGLKAGDVITGLNGDKLNAFRPQDAEDFKTAIENLSVGEKADLEVLRAGKSMKVSIVLEGQPKPSEYAAKAKQKEFEFAVRDIMPLDRMEREWTKDQKGVIVTDTTSGGLANIAGLEAEDVILSINGQSVDNVADFETAIKAAMEKKPKIVQIFVKRGPRTHFIFIEPEWTKLSGSL
ncbi:MAG TPA: PDZ domain-containing protein [Chthonomonadaceae bacterium]|nr:PDZ domain-containing protein [Chthonomonadaceae bacterium]